MRALIVHNISFALCASIVLAPAARSSRATSFSSVPADSAFCRRASASAPSSAPCWCRAASTARRSMRSSPSFVLIWIRGALLIASGDYRVVAIAGAFCTGAAWTGVFSSLSAGTQTSGAGLGACPVGRDEPHRGAGGDGHRQRVLGMACGVDRPARCDGGRRRARCFCCSASIAACG
jgi:hypothetical protein